LIITITIITTTTTADTVVNQLLSKIDGVNALNNILLIGMTNRKDMIDDALLRPGRLEVQVEINLPDEAGRAQILKIKTAAMREGGYMDAQVLLLLLLLLLHGRVGGGREQWHRAAHAPARPCSNNNNNNNKTCASM
jgi:hypothetical protein